MKFIFPILFVSFSIVAFVFGVNPLYKDVKDLKSEIVVYNTALDNSTNLQKTEDSLIAAYNNIKQVDKDRLGNLLPSSVNNIQFILELERIANLHSMPIKDIKFEASKRVAQDPNTVSSASTDSRLYGVFPLEFSTEGTYDSFVVFLKDLESNLRLVDIKSISFVVPDALLKNTDVNPNIYKYSLKVETYWLK